MEVGKGKSCNSGPNKMKKKHLFRTRILTETHLTQLIEWCVPSTLIKRELFCFSYKDVVLVQDNSKKYMEKKSRYRKGVIELSLIFLLPKKVGLEKLTRASFPPEFSTQNSRNKVYIVFATCTFKTH